MNDKLKTWLTTLFKNFTITTNIADASFRKYFRIKDNTNNKQYIVMDSSYELDSFNNFLTVHKILTNNNISVPKIYYQNLKLAYLVLEDLGNISLLDSKNNLGIITIKHYYTAIDNLIKIQNINLAKIANHKQYDSTLLMLEANLFKNWYLEKLKLVKLTNLQKITLNTELELLITNILKQKQVFTHRDYHSRNIMLSNKSQVLIDFQDAIIGSYLYDLCSLLADAYYKLSDDYLAALLLYYYKKAKLGIDYEQYLIDFKNIAIQRQLKVLGIFARLSIRDNKHQYLGNIPLVRKYLLANLDNYLQLNTIKQLLCVP